MDSDTASEVELNLISLDYKALEIFQKANFYTFCKRNGFVVCASELDQKVLCLATDLTIDELSSSLEIPVKKFGKARGPDVNGKDKGIEIQKDMLRELPRTYSRNSLAPIDSDSELEESAEQPNLTEVFEGEVHVSN